ncbi:MAG: ATP-binding protein [Bacteroidota bacterium]
MARTVKQKIRSGTLFLFLLLLLSGGVCIYYLVRLKNDSKLILEDNYESLDYCHSMQQSIDSLPANAGKYLTQFESALSKQEANITEPGEAAATSSLRNEFRILKKGDTSFSIKKSVNQQLQVILSLNMAAIKRKNLVAEKTANEAVTYLSIIGAIIFIVALTFTFNFPSVITNPINRFTEAIRQIADKNYKHRIHINNKDEFGQMADAFNTMAERLEYFESSNLNKLLFEKSRAEAVINSLKDASVGIDKNETVLFANNQALQLLGFSADDIIGKTVQEISKRNDLFRFLLEEKSTSPFKVVIDNKENYFIKEIIEVAQEESGSKVIVLKNITSFKELDVAKTNFIATVSHELKTPLASSDFSLKLLEDSRVSKLTDEQHELVQQLKSDNQRMLRILSELLNMSQIEAGKIQLNTQVLIPYQIVDASMQAVHSAAKEKNIVLEQKIGEDLPDIRSDADKISWVLNNFLTNAIKYSPAETTVVIHVERKENFISFSVTDRGEGIEEKYIDRIFERYFQIPGRSDKKGSGIGLAICKEFIEAMGGKIWVKSKAGEGSTFGFDLPAMTD